MRGNSVTAPAPGTAAADSPVSARLAGLVLLFSATLWGLSWWPMQQLAAAGVAGPVLSLLAYGSAGLLGLPLLLGERGTWQRHPIQVAMIAAFGGWAAASFILAMTQGDVVREMLLFYLAPAWSVLGGRVALQERLSARRAVAVVVALAGASLVIRAGGAVGGARITLADVLALSSGITFAANNLAMRAAREISVRSKTIIMMLGCGALSALAVAVAGSPMPPASTGAALGVGAFALVWIVGGSMTTAFGMSHLEAGRSALIILAELVAAVVSASLAQHRVPSTPELAGAALILGAAALEVLES